MENKIVKALCEIKNTKPLVHCITNPISITRCADLILALGARPIMAEHPKETAGITKTAEALLLNLGNITDARKKSMLISGRIARKNKIPVVIDVVGISCSNFRRKYALRLICASKPAIIKGNYSEIYALYSEKYKSQGVDADKKLTKEEVTIAATFLSKKYDAVILASGKEDIVALKNKVSYIRNGTEKFTTVTGTGCMLGAVCACFLSAEEPYYAAVFSCVIFGICGERATDKNFIQSAIENAGDLYNTKLNYEVINIEKT